MSSRTLRWLGIVLITGIGLIHLALAPREYAETPYMGLLFAANFLGAIIAAVGIYRGQAWGWALGVLIAAGALVGYILSRTVGLPGMGIEAWLDPVGLLSLVVEVVFVALVSMIKPWAWQAARSG